MEIDKYLFEVCEGNLLVFVNGEECKVLVEGNFKVVVIDKKIGE